MSEIGVNSGLGKHYLDTLGQKSKSLWGGLEAGDKLGIGLGAVAGFGTYFDDRHNGAGVVHSAVHAAADQAFWTVAGGWGMAYALGQGAMELGAAGYMGVRTMESNLARGSRPFAQRYNDTPVAATMRQRSVQAIQESKMNARSALGNEAQYFHR